MLKNVDLTGRIISYMKNNGDIIYYMVKSEQENFLMLKELYTGTNFTTCVNKTCVLKNYELVNTETSTNEFKHYCYSPVELSQLRLELRSEGHDDSSIDRMIEQLSKNS